MAHMHYKGTGKVHSFRGLLSDVADSNQRKIRIQGPVGAIAWRITKLEVMTNEPGQTDHAEHIVKVYREEQSTIDGAVNFDDNELLAAAVCFNRTDASQAFPTTAIIFDNAIFSRNIWVTHFETINTIKCNYYIELEEVKVSAAGMAQLAVAAARRTI